ncbi:MAG: M23 family metallopeptidase [Proteobacteria bacterium]|nr:M23 family metallopeptidase [Pseudomonadota bacterium]MBU1594723.1 M23 family metallopeptidase [Pseudomonadota bacterium]
MDKKGSGAFVRNVLLLLLLAALGLGVYAFIRDGRPPVLGLSPQGSAASYNTDFTLTLKTRDIGLKNLSIYASQDGRSVEVLKRSFDGKPLEHTEIFRLPRDTAFKEGPIELSIEARTHSLLFFLGRGKASLVRKYTLDFTPPHVTVNQGVHNVNQGGAGAVSFTVSKPVQRVGVAVGEYFFPAFQQKSGDYFCYFAMPYDMPPGSFKPRVMVRDLAGNEATQTLYIYAIPKNFKFDKLNVSDEFLNDKMSQYSAQYPQEQSPLDIYKRVNSELRKQNEVDLRRIAEDTSNSTLWSGPFLRLPNAAGRAGFGDQRDYFYNGMKIDHQTHLGVDLASLANAPVPAANDGKVAFAGFLGIYGNCVIIDHGLGLQSLYSHLDSMDVAKGAEVKRGQFIGKTGTTGLAGGDHLHFGILISGVQVSPVEWWDEHWIQDNVLKHLNRQQ